MQHWLYMGIYGTWCWTRPIQTIASKMICMLKTCVKFCHFIFPTSKTRLSRKLQTPLLFLWQYCTLTLETVNLLKPSGIRYFVLLSLPYPMLGIRYWPLNFLLTLLSIPFGLRQLGYMKKIFLSILQLKRSLFEQRLKLRSTRHCL